MENHSEIKNWIENDMDSKIKVMKEVAENIWETLPEFLWKLSTLEKLKKTFLWNSICKEHNIEESDIDEMVKKIGTQEKDVSKKVFHLTAWDPYTPDES